MCIHVTHVYIPLLGGCYDYIYDGPLELPGRFEQGLQPIRHCLCGEFNTSLHYRQLWFVGNTQAAIAEAESTSRLTHTAARLICKMRPHTHANQALTIMVSMRDSIAIAA